MADLAVWQRTIVDEKGNIIPGAEVSVRSYPGGSLITLYEGPDGAQVKGNPFVTGSDGFARFWAESQRVEIVAVGAGSSIRWIVDLINADEVIGDAISEATAAAAVAVGEAEAAADRAEAARDAAQLNARIYPSTAAGLAATTDGDYFSVPSSKDDEYLILYRNDSGSAESVASYPSASLVSGLNGLSVNRGKHYPFRQANRGGVVTDGNLFANRIFLDVKVIGSEEELGGRYFSIAYLQNGAALSHGEVAGVRIEEFDASSYASEGDATVIHATSDAPLGYGQASSGIQTFMLRPARRPGILIQITMDLDELPAWGTPLALANNTGNRHWSFHIDPSCHLITSEPGNPSFSRGKYPFKSVAPTDVAQVAISDRVSRAIIDARIVAPVDKIRGYFYRLDYLQNKAVLDGQARYGVRFSRYEVDGQGRYAVSSREFIHTPDATEANYDIELGGIQTFTLQMSNDPSVTAIVTLDTDQLTVGETVNMWRDTSIWYHTDVLDPSCYTPLPETQGTGAVGLTGIGAMGASLMTPVNGWFEAAAGLLSVKAYNKAVGGIGTPTYFADKLWRNNFCTDEEFDDIDVLTIQFASSSNLDDDSNLLPTADDYTSGFDPDDPSNQFTIYSHAQNLDYILKYWQEWCLTQKDNPSSKWYGTPHGKPFRVMFVTHWHDARENYNEAVRVVAARWGAGVCELDRKIGFSRATPLPNGEQVSVLYALDTEEIAGTTYGWHPARGNDGVYIQNRMANIFANAIREWFSQGQA